MRLPRRTHFKLATIIDLGLENRKREMRSSRVATDGEERLDLKFLEREWPNTSSVFDHGLDLLDHEKVGPPIFFLKCREFTTFKSQASTKFPNCTKMEKS